MREHEAQLPPAQAPQDAGAAGAGKPSPPSPKRRNPFLLWIYAALAAVGCGTLLGMFLFVPPPDGNGGTYEPQDDNPTHRMFAGWGKPDMALLLSGEMHGYLQPCGCSEPQYGGMVRRYNFLKLLEAKGWPVVAADLGDIARGTGRQSLMKYYTAMEALKRMNYTAIGIGKNEFQLTLIDLLAEFALQQGNNSPRILAANLEGRKKDEMFESLVEATEISQKLTAPRVGIMGMVAPSVATKVKDPNVKFAVNQKGKLDNGPVIVKSLVELRDKKADFVVLLYQGAIGEAREAAKYCQAVAAQNPKLPPVRVIVCQSEGDEPPSAPEPVAGTQVQIITLGHKGKYVGVLGAYRGKQPSRPWEWKYQLVRIGPEFETPKGQEAAHPVMIAMEDYTKKVKAANLLAQHIQSLHPVQLVFPKSKYVGSKRCQDCHPSAYQVWENPGMKKWHSRAYKTLEDAKNPSLQQFNPECVMCHVVGFGKTDGFTDAKDTGRLKNVGCESCHGPCSEHVKDPWDTKLYPHINPLRASDEERKLEAKKAKLAKAKPAASLLPDEGKRLTQVHQRRMLNMDKFCQSCHDVENDVHWNFDKKWPQVIHMTPPNERANRNRPQPQVQGDPQPPVLEPAALKKN
jgi:hypothetical protein